MFQPAGATPGRAARTRRISYANIFRLGKKITLEITLIVPKQITGKIHHAHRKKKKLRKQKGPWYMTPIANSKRKNGRGTSCPLSSGVRRPCVHTPSPSPLGSAGAHRWPCSRKAQVASTLRWTRARRLAARAQRSVSPCATLRPLRNLPRTFLLAPPNHLRKRTNACPAKSGPTMLHSRLHHEQPQPRTTTDGARTGARSPSRERGGCETPRALAGSATG